jgi:hypothetical protein
MLSKRGMAWRCLYSTDGVRKGLYLRARRPSDTRSRWLTPMASPLGGEGRFFTQSAGEKLDLNPHEIVPASTSKYLTGFPGVACSCVVKRLRIFELPGISPISSFVHANGTDQRFCVERDSTVTPFTGSESTRIIASSFRPFYRVANSACGSSRSVFFRTASASLARIIATANPGYKSDQAAFTRAHTPRALRDDTEKRFAPRLGGIRIFLGACGSLRRTCGERDCPILNAGRHAGIHLQAGALLLSEPVECAYSAFFDQSSTNADLEPYSRYGRLLVAYTHEMISGPINSSRARIST